MLKIQRFVCNMFQENCYIVSDETNECVIIDCGAFYDEEKAAVTGYIRDNGLTPRHLLCTHGHIDHNFGNSLILDEYGLSPQVNRDDAVLIASLNAQAKAFTGIDYGITSPAISHYISENDKIEFGRHTFSVISTPGHTPGSVLFYCENEGIAFSGDTLFHLSIGRTDLQLGNHDSMMDSLRKIVNTLPSETKILPGHGEATTMKDETTYNPYIKTAIGRWQ